jgi:hypothetical protein
MSTGRNSSAPGGLSFDIKKSAERNEQHVKLDHFVRILMSTIAPKLSEFATKTYSLPCHRICKQVSKWMCNKETSKMFNQTFLWDISVSTGYRPAASISPWGPNITGPKHLQNSQQQINSVLFQLTETYDDHLNLVSENYENLKPSFSFWKPGHSRYKTFLRNITCN